MKGPERESAVILLGIAMQLLKHCGAIQNFDCSGFYSPFFGLRTFQFFGQRTAFALRRIDHSLSQRLSDCAFVYGLIIYSTIF